VKSRFSPWTLLGFGLIISQTLLFTSAASGQLIASPSTVNFGSVPIGSGVSQSVVLTNNGKWSRTITQDAVSGSGFSISGLKIPVTLHVGQSVTFTTTFAPQSGGSVTGSVSLNSPNLHQKVYLTGTGSGTAQLSANPTTLGFGSVQVGNSMNLSETVTNTGGSSVTISQANVSGAGFSISGLSLPMTLSGGQSVTFTATFAPTGAGAASGTLAVVSNASNSPLNIALSGTGTSAGQLAVSPTSLSFGNVAVGSSSALGGSLIASGSSVTITSASLNNSEFVLSGISLPATLTAGQSASFTVTFTPQASGATSASLTFISNAANSPTMQSMTGTGTATTQHTVDLTWDASSGAVGYNVYRGTVSGGPYSMINSTLDTTTAYTDSTVASGQTYYYVVTAINSESQESGYSNQAQAVIPNP
jgi:ASPM-SPD-2-Hydin domain-containing protein/HYDIN/CFA65/VesB family protein